MLKYGKKINFNPERLNPLNIDRQSTELIPERSRVLDIGCATGFIGRYLKSKKKCEVWGIELGKEEAREAKKYLDKIIVGDIEDIGTANQIKGKFDIVFASAIVEHLKEPGESLKHWKKFIKKNGKLIITTSNIAHWSQRLSLLKGEFEYKDYGILDNTHLHFYTPTTFRKLLKESGYNIEHFSIDPVGGGIPRISKILSKIFPNIFAYQMLILASPKR